MPLPYCLEDCTTDTHPPQQVCRSVWRHHRSGHKQGRVHTVKRRQPNRSWFSFSVIDRKEKRNDRCDSISVHSWSVCTSVCTSDSVRPSGSRVINGTVRWSKVEVDRGGPPSAAALCVPSEKQQLQRCPTAALLCIQLTPTQRHAGAGETSASHTSFHGPFNCMSKLNLRMFHMTGVLMYSDLSSSVILQYAWHCLMRGACSLCTGAFLLERLCKWSLLPTMRIDCHCCHTASALAQKHTKKMHTTD